MTFESSDGLSDLNLPEPPDRQRERWHEMTVGELQDIRDQQSKYLGELAMIIHLLREKHGLKLGEITEINGWIRDRL